MTPDLVDMKKAIANPSGVFDTPVDIVEHAELSKDEKVKLLRVWETDALELETAAQESMTGGEASRLREVHEALRMLEESQG